MGNVKRPLTTSFQWDSSGVSQLEMGVERCWYSKISSSHLSAPPSGLNSGLVERGEFIHYDAVEVEVLTAQQSNYKQCAMFLCLHTREHHQSTRFHVCQIVFSLHKNIGPSKTRFLVLCYLCTTLSEDRWVLQNARHI